MTGFRSGLVIGAKIGNGHFGEVFLGRDEVHGEVAVKVLRRAPDHSDEAWAAFKAGFQAEARHLSKAAHRNIVPVYHIVETTDGDSIQFCMAFCPGGSLQSAFEKGPMTLPDVRKTATEVLLGLGALHARQMLHRDIKPGNVLVDGDGVARISDFGLVTDDLLLGYGSQAGYCDHIAHEVWHGKGTSVRSDVWAFGMTIYRLLHGKAWYDESPNPRDTVPAGGFADTLRWLPHVPRSWRRTLRKTLADDPARRLQNASQALEALSRLPITPAWVTSVAGDMVRWELRSATRLNVVEWRRHAPRKHDWSAWSEPLETGRKKTLGGSDGVVGSRQAIAGLETYFGV